MKLNSMPVPLSTEYRPHYSPGDSRLADIRAAFHSSSATSKDQSRLTTLGATAWLVPDHGGARFIEVRGIATHRQTGSSGMNRS
jgi:hypothetical protein